MAFYVYGINYRTAPIALREQMALAHGKLAEPLGNLLLQDSVSEAMILSTCHRCELYTVASSPISLKNWLHVKHDTVTTSFKPFVYEYYEEKAMAHLLRVACGLDSLALGESQILGQLKQAFQEAKKINAIGPFLGHLVEAVFSQAKKIRHYTGINEYPVSIASTAVKLVKKVYPELASSSVLLLGAGETAELVAHHLQEQGVGQLIIANRTRLHAENLVRLFGGKEISLEEIPLYLPTVDAVIATTASPTPLLEMEVVKEAMKKKSNSSLLLVDVGMPRNIASEVGDIPQVHLFNVDDLQSIAQEGLEGRQKAAKQAEQFIDLWVQQYEQQLKGIHFINTIKSFRERVTEMQQREVHHALRALSQGDDPANVLSRMAQTITKKMMHYPTIQLRRASQTGNMDLLKIAKQLFDVE